MRTKKLKAEMDRISALEEQHVLREREAKVGKAWREACEKWQAAFAALVRYHDLENSYANLVEELGEAPDDLVEEVESEGNNYWAAKQKADDATQKALELERDKNSD